MYYYLRTLEFPDMASYIYSICSAVITVILFLVISWRAVAEVRAIKQDSQPVPATVAIIVYLIVAFYVLQSLVISYMFFSGSLCK